MADSPSYSINTYVGDGARIVWNFNFAGGYISPAHVFVRTRIDDVATNVDFTFVNGTTVSIAPPIPAGVTFDIYRNTPKDAPIANFTDGSVISEANLDTNADQAVFIAAEAIDAATIAVRGPAGYKGDPGADTSSIGLFNQVAGLNIPTGVQTVTTTGFWMAGVGRGLYIYDAEVDTNFVAAHPRWSFQSSDSRGWRLATNADGCVQFDTFGPHGDALTDDYPAWVALLDYLNFYSIANPNTDYRKLIPVTFGPGPYRHNTRLEGKVGSFTLLGFGSVGSPDGGHGTTFLAGPGVGGLTIQNYNTAGETTDPTPQPNRRSAAGSNIDNFCFESLGGSTTNHHGLWIRGGNVRARNIIATQWSQDGIHIEGTPGGVGAQAGLADSVFLENPMCIHNNRDGISLQGGDANACLIINPQCLQNGRWGVNDFGALGNTYMGGQLDGNGYFGLGRTVDTPNESGALCTYDGNQYGVVYGQDTLASTTVPGTDDTVWYLLAAGGGNAFIPTWSSGTAWQAGGAAVFVGASGASFWGGCYAESGQGLIQNVGRRALFLGGLGSQYILGGIGAVTIIGGRLTSFSGYTAVQSLPDPINGQTEASVGGESPADAILRAANTVVAPLGFNWTFDFTLKQLVLRYGGSDPEMIAYSGPSSVRTYGRSSALTNPAVHISSLFIGPGDTARNLTFDTQAPVSGNYARGDKVHTVNPTLGGVDGWTCSVQGTPGTWVPTGIVGGVQALAQANSAATTIAGLVTDFNALLAKLRTANLLAT